MKSQEVHMAGSFLLVISYMIYIAWTKFKIDVGVRF